MARLSTVFLVGVILLSWSMLIISVILASSLYRTSLNEEQDNLVLLLLSELETRMEIFVVVATLIMLAMVFKLVQRDFKAKKRV